MKHFAKFNRWQFERVTTWHVGKAKRDEFIARRRREMLAWEVAYTKSRVDELAADYQDLVAKMTCYPSIYPHASMATPLDEFCNEFQFVSFKSVTPATREDLPVYELQDDGTWVEIGEHDWREIDWYETELLSAWEAYNEALYAARDITPEQWRELRKQGITA